MKPVTRALNLPLRILETVWRFRSAKVRVGLIILIALVLAGILEPLITEFRFGALDPLEIGAFPKDQPPSPRFPLGTDYLGRDYLTMFLVALRNSLAVGFLAGVAAILIAIIVGFLAGYKGGFIDSLLSSITNAMLILPSWLLLATLVAFAPRALGIVESALLTSIFIWPWSARSLRAQVLSLRERPYIDMARVTNEGTLEIIFEELLPNLLPYIITGFSGTVIGAIFFETSIRLLGLGPQGYVSLGLLVNIAITNAYFALGYYHLLLPPIVALILIFVSLNLINIGLDEFFNPRLRKVTGL